jgi:hypothetical protein
MVPQLAAHRAVGEKAGPSGKASSDEAIEIGVWAWPTDYFDTAGMLFKDQFLEVRRKSVIIVIVIIISSIIIIITSRFLSLVMSSLPLQLVLLKDLGRHQRHLSTAVVWRWCVAVPADELLGR